MITQPDQPDWRLTFRPAPSDVPVEHRVRRLLKTALRALGLRCVRVETLPVATPSPEDFSSLPEDLLS